MAKILCIDDEPSLLQPPAQRWRDGRRRIAGEAAQRGQELRVQVEKLERANAALRVKGREASRAAKLSAARARGPGGPAPNSTCQSQATDFPFSGLNAKMLTPPHLQGSKNLPRR